MPKIMYNTSPWSNASFKRSEIVRYLLKEQGYDEETLQEMSITELVDLYEMYHED